MSKSAPIIFRFLLILLVLSGFGESRLVRAQLPVTTGVQPRASARNFVATRLVTPWRIDGFLDLDAVNGSTPLTGLRQFGPRPGAPASQATDIYFAYDNEAIYVAARLYDSAPDSILRQLSERDRLGNTDFFAVSINPYRDGINTSNFLITPAGVQYDSKFIAGDAPGGLQPMTDGDATWDAIWSSAAQVDSLGWTVEMRIPYSMLRFAEADVQSWDINFARQIRRHREESYWSFVDPKGTTLPTQMGQVSGLAGLRPPVRLQATPFVTAGAIHRFDPQGNRRNSVSEAFGGGLDLKYGISDAFTLDMTLVPDFSNARSDDQVLNLSAREVQFNENRSFFTEGVELFNKGGYFYSRRIGGRPVNFDLPYALANENESVIENPARAQLLNATKVSGRLGNGLGIGVFTAVEGESRARLRDERTGAERDVTTAPLTNYSVAVLDQNLPNNSFATLLNTTVLRAGSTYDANLTALVWDLRDQPNNWGLSGTLGISQQYGLQRGTPAPENVFGHKLNLAAQRITGRLRYGLSYGEESDKYDANDLGLLFFSNSREAELFGEYNWFEPFGRFNNASVSAFLGTGRLYRPSQYNYAGSGGSFRVTTRRFFTFGGNVFSELKGERQFQDTRTPGVGLQFPAYAEVGGFLSSDYRKPFALDIRTNFGGFYRDGRTRSTQISFSPRARVGDRLAFRTESQLSVNRRSWGYVGHSAASAKTYALEGKDTGFNLLNPAGGGYADIREDGIVMSYRDVESIENQFVLEYSFTANVNVNLRVRHYWSRVRHSGFFEIDRTGQILSTSYTGLNEDGRSLYNRSFNAFNVDGFFRWRFAPGSDVFVSYKTQSYYGGYLQGGYGRNLRALNEDTVDNSLTLKFVYWLDYNGLRERLRQG